MRVDLRNKIRHFFLPGLGSNFLLIYGVAKGRHQIDKHSVSDNPAGSQPM